MYFQFLIEDKSSNTLIEIIMQKFSTEYPSVDYNCKFFKGIGGFTKRSNAKEIKTGKLLNDLAGYLKGFNKSLQGIEAVIFIVVDNDDRNKNDFQIQLETVAQKNNITIDHAFCIAVEEVEAWLLGDQNAVLSAYPQAKQAVLHSYVQDSICRTWDKLADAVYPGGLSKFRKDCPTYMEIGKYKNEWTKKIGSYMDITNNKSPSFNHFITEINKRLPQQSNTNE